MEAAEALGHDQESWEDPEEFIDPVRTHSNLLSRRMLPLLLLPLLLCRCYFPLRSLRLQLRLVY